MKQDYNELMKRERSSFGDNPKLLLHCCCAPCSSAVLERLTSYFDITLYYYNPNIYPANEYLKRAGEFQKLGVKLVQADYDYSSFLLAIKGKEQSPEGGERCQACIALRLENSFKYAKENDFALVTTTLTISPHKDSIYINELGEQLMDKYNIAYLHADFKKENGYLRSIEISKELGIYRQDYCGCAFSVKTKKSSI